MSSVAQLRGLTLLEKLPRPDKSAHWVSPEDVLGHVRLFNPDTAESVLALLGSLRLPFWLTSPALTLTGHGWTVEEIGLLLDDVHQVGTRPASLAENRLRRAGEGRLKRPAPRDDGHTCSPVPQPAIDPGEAPKNAPGTAPWDRDPAYLWDGTPVPSSAGEGTSWSPPAPAGSGPHRWCDPSVDCGH
ncbi:hypothetical protein [Streptomyces sp. TR02-1]|uniref:hypothetical protein n=1 Tax=Streptomyces sp. TR02-1 TaxID=3385977 RepID=UPI0039A10C75